MDSKDCKMCKQQFPASTEFWYKQKCGKFGLKSLCKKCSCLKRRIFSSTPEAKEAHRLKMLKWRQDNREKAREISRKSNLKTRLLQNERRKYLYHNDLEYRAKRDEQDKAYRRSEKGKLMINKEVNKQNSRDRNKRYRTLFHEKVKAYNDEFRAQNKEYLHRLHKANREEIKPAYVAQSMRKSVKDLPSEIIESRRIIIQLKRELKLNNIKIK